MRKSFLSLAALAFALAVSAPIVGVTGANAAAMQAKPAATAPGSDAMAKKHMKKHHHVTMCKATKKHKCPMKHHHHKKHTMMKPKAAMPK
ncbi:MAG: hypothetical protein EOR60_09630 [Mesorhizobium sp.]|nr:MAG: hypothetical protein EOR60_09630 [Mesorhizobium sp.]